MYTCVHAQKNTLRRQVDKRDTHPKKNFAKRHTWTKKLKMLKCVHAYLRKRSKKSQPKD
jgi:hypothetical protein